LFGLARIATGDRIEAERFAQTQNMHVNLGCELSRPPAPSMIAYVEQPKAARAKGFCKKQLGGR
jgi:hypothetical protein